MGLTKDESSRYQKLAAIPAEHFATTDATAKATARLSLWVNLFDRLKTERAANVDRIQR